jgi:hypothetical protein
MQEIGFRSVRFTEALIISHSIQHQQQQQLWSQLAKKKRKAKRALIIESLPNFGKLYSCVYQIFQE